MVSGTLGKYNVLLAHDFLFYSDRHSSNFTFILLVRLTGADFRLLVYSLNHFPIRSYPLLTIRYSLNLSIFTPIKYFIATFGKHCYCRIIYRTFLLQEDNYGLGLHPPQYDQNVASPALFVLPCRIWLDCFIMLLAS